MWSESARSHASGRPVPLAATTVSKARAVHDGAPSMMLVVVGVQLQAKKCGWVNRRLSCRGPLFRERLNIVNKLTKH